MQVKRRKDHNSNCGPFGVLIQLISWMFSIETTHLSKHFWKLNTKSQFTLSCILLLSSVRPIWARMRTFGCMLAPVCLPTAKFWLFLSDLISVDNGFFSIFRPLPVERQVTIVLKCGGHKSLLFTFCYSYCNPPTFQ